MHSHEHVDHGHPERIIPRETTGGPLWSHLKRYDFARQFCKGKIVLDAACGVGYGTAELATVARHVTGVDISPEAIAYAQDQYNGSKTSFSVMNVENLDFEDERFDVVCSFETLEHVPDPERFIREVRRVLRAEGTFVLSTPNSAKTNHRPDNPYHTVEFSHSDLEGLLRQHFGKVEMLGQRRLQSEAHQKLQRLDRFGIRAMLPSAVRKVLAHAVATKSWDESGLDDFIISPHELAAASELLAVCSSPKKSAK